jgi:uncharacterized membrane protein
MKSLVRWITLGCYLGLIAMIAAWNLTSPPTSMSLATMLVIALVPLLVMAPGMLRAAPKSHAYMAYISLLYLTHGLVTAATPGDPDRLLGVAEAVLALFLMVGAALIGKAYKRGL